MITNYLLIIELSNILIVFLLFFNYIFIKQNNGETMSTINGHPIKDVLSFISGKSQKEVFSFLDKNRPKKFTADNISTRCDISVIGVHRVLKSLLEKEVLTKTQNEFKRNVYQLNLDGEL